MRLTVLFIVLNVLAGRSVGVVRGNIYANGVEPDSEYYRNAGFVEQFDLHGEFPLSLKLCYRAESSSFARRRSSICSRSSRILRSPPNGRLGSSS